MVDYRRQLPGRCTTTAHALALAPARSVTVTTFAGVVHELFLWKRLVRRQHSVRNRLP